MSKKTIVSMAAIIVCLGAFVVSSAIAQTQSASVSQDVITMHHQRLYQLMKDMNQEMGMMTEQMSRGAPTPDQRTQMAKRGRPPIGGLG